jgi:glycine cleavage system H protein
MTIFLVLATVLTIVVVEWQLARRKSRIANAARRAIQFVEGPSTGRPPPGILLHPGHTWVQVHDENLASIGLTDFAASFAGQLATVELPSEGRRLRQAGRACTLVSARDRRLNLLMPIEGKVLAVNRELEADPELCRRRPYGEGWLLRVRPRHLRDTLRNLLPSESAQTWIDATRAAVTAKLAPAVGAALGDGGELVPDFGDQLDDRRWQAIARELFPSDGDARAAGEERPGEAKDRER